MLKAGILPGGQNSAPLQAVWDSVLLTLNEPQKNATLEPREPIPVTILAGFLGSGKTTLLCHLLENTSLSIVAIVNDLAAINVDAAKVRRTNTETIEFENGCACCVLGSDLGRALAELCDRETPPDAVVIEASGVSDPMGIAQTVSGIEGVVLDGIVALVDGQHWARQAADPQTSALFLRQLEAAHLIVVTKCASTTQDYREISDLVPGRALLESAQIYRGDPTELLIGAALRGARLPVEATQHDLSSFTSQVISWRHEIEVEPFINWLEEVPIGVYRIKGALTLQENGASKPVEIQAVSRRWRISPLRQGEQESYVVVIGATEDPSFLQHVSRLQEMVDPERDQ
jgi:G3E family GTPase